MHQINKLFFFITFIFSFQCIHAQEFGGFPTSKKWKQTNAENIRIIFPKGLDSIANEILNITTALSHQSSFSLGSKHTNANIILQNQHVIPNGYAGLGPQRSEFFLTPPSDNFSQGTSSWTKQLAIHEFRHIQQFQSMQKGVSKLLYKIFGDDVFNAAINTAIPNWYFEGEAVYAETKYTEQGRGQLPSFLKRIPALWQSNKKYNWMQLRNGSIKKYTPNHYDIGYLLVKYGYDHYGENFWKNITQQAVTYKGIFYPFQKAIYRNSGLTYREFRKRAFSSLFDTYNNDSLINPNALSKDRISKKHTIYTNYLEPKFYGDSILFIKESFQQNPSFGYIVNNKEKKLTNKYISIESNYGLSDHKIVYSAYSKHPRWNWITYNDIVILDINTRKQHKITQKGKYFSPELSKDGTKIIVSQFNDKSQSSLVLLDAKSGENIKTFFVPNTTYLSHPKFMNDSTLLTITRTSEGLSTLMGIHIPSSNTKNILPKTNRIIGDISVHNQLIYFTVSDSLQDKIAKYKLGDSAVYFLISKDIASYAPNANDSNLLRSIFSAQGYFLKSNHLANLSWERIALSKFSKDDFLTQRIEKKIITTPSVQHIDTNYRISKQILNFHSWRPDYNSPIYSIKAYGNNLLNNTSTEINLSYNENEKSYSMGGSFIYGGLYPMLFMGSNFGFNRSIIKDSTSFLFHQLDHQLGFTIPLSFINKNRYSSVQFQSSINLKQLFFKDSIPNRIGTKHWYMVHQLQYNIQRQMARMQILPSLALYSNVQMRYTISKDRYAQLVLQIKGNLPGILKTHTIQINNTAQLNNSNTQFFSNRISYARNYEGIRAQKALSNSFNYHLPLFYPDWGFANILYLQRVRANIFYDQSFTSNKVNNFVNSAGAEIYIDTKWWNQHPLSFGFRYGYTLQHPKPFYEFILPVAYF
ncbi:MAG: hypothetical protein E6Q95_06210 [Chitinophagaceae bacterium]|nr:MAG: hypothetical protein E6Q95_06210 [Chitinophagaceae bacterium]